MQRPRWILALMAVTLLMTAARSRAQTSSEILSKGKAATALVIIGEEEVFGSAFCIHPSGLFVTNAHVVEGAGDRVPCFLVLHPGEKNQKRYPAHVVRLNKELDLALLQIQSQATFPTLEPGDSDTVQETQSVVAFGFPFGSDLAPKGEYPNVTVTTGRITALRKVEGSLAALQMDAAIYPGNSGGPLLNAKGQVVGIVVAKLREAEGINFAIPVNHLRALMHQTEIVFSPPPIPRARQHEKQDFVIGVATFASSSSSFQVELSLRVEDGPARTFTAQTTNGHTFHVSAIPVPANPPAGKAPSVAYHIVARQQRRIVAESQGALAFAETASVSPRPAPGRIQGNAALAFSQGRTYKVPVAADIVTAADLDGDHVPDVIIGGGKELGVLYGKRDGTLESYQRLLTWEAGVANRATVDLNNDGRPDIVFTDGLGRLVILYSRGKRQFDEPVFKSIGVGGPIYIGDINRDGRPDLIVGTGHDFMCGLKVLLNEGDGAFPFREVSSFGVGGSVDGIDARDLNGDGIPDLAVGVAVTTGNGGRVRIYLGDGKGGFKEGQTYSLGESSMPGVTLMDVNGDGKPDLLVCDYWNAHVSVLFGKGDGSFGDLENYPASGYPRMIRMADFNRDGHPDFVVASTKNFVLVYRNRTDGMFYDPLSLEVDGGDCRSVFVADFNGDGKPDLVTQNQERGTVTVLINRTGEK